MISINSIFEIFRKSKSLKFVVQEHHADRAGLHYDLRLEKDGVAKSWATRKLPELVEMRTKKIQMFPTPDHDLEWMDFEGKITDGYGKGEVKIWDKGTYDILKWTDKSIVLDFHGQRLREKYIIVHTPQNYWLMFKKRK